MGIHSHCGINLRNSGEKIMRILQVVELGLDYGWAAGLHRERMAPLGAGVPALRFNDGFFCVVSFH